MLAEEEITSNTLSVSVEEIQINTGFPADAFEFVPPDEADVSAGPGGRLSFGGGWSGFASSGKDDSGRVEHRGSHEREGETLVEHSKWKLKGTTLLFERRLTAYTSSLHPAQRFGVRSEVDEGLQSILPTGSLKSSAIGVVISDRDAGVCGYCIQRLTGVEHVDVPDKFHRWK